MPEQPEKAPSLVDLSLRDRVAYIGTASPQHTVMDDKGNKIVPENLYEAETRTQMANIGMYLTLAKYKKHSKEEQDETVEFCVRKVRSIYPAQEGLLRELVEAGDKFSAARVVFDDSIEESNRKLDAFLNPQE